MLVTLIYVNKNSTSSVKEMILKWHLDRSISAMIGQIAFFCSEQVFLHHSDADIWKRGEGQLYFNALATPRPSKKFFARSSPDDKGWRWNSSVRLCLQLFTALTFLCVISWKKGFRKGSRCSWHYSQMSTLYHPLIKWDSFITQQKCPGHLQLAGIIWITDQNS